MSTLIIFVMGVSGTGKSTIGRLLSEAIQLPFFDGDDYHPIENIRKMQSGHALDDTDRQGWLEALHALAVKQEQETGAIIACSALKQKYRDLLGNGLQNPCLWVFLSGSFEMIHARMQARGQHFMPPALLQSQLDTLEPPQNALELDIALSPEEMIQRIVLALDHHNFKRAV